MNLHFLPGGVIPTNAFLLAEPGLGQAVLIDAPGGIWGQVEPILRKEKCRLVELWITHGHFDHMQGGAEVVRAAGPLVRAHPDDRRLIENPKVMQSFAGMEFPLEPVKVDHWLRAGERLAVLGTEAEVRHVPGHCPGNVLFYFPSLGAAFVGDALFNRGVGRTDFAGGDFETLSGSIRKQIYTLPDDTRVFSGHGPETTVGAEKAGNPYVRA